MTASPRSQKEDAIAAKFPPDSKKGKGPNRVLMLTGDTAKALGRKNYDSVKLSELSDEEIDKLHKLVTAAPKYANSADMRRASMKTATGLDFEYIAEKIRDDLWDLKGVQCKALADKATKAITALGYKVVNVDLDAHPREGHFLWIDIVFFVGDSAISQKEMKANIYRALGVGWAVSDNPTEHGGEGHWNIMLGIEERKPR